MSDETPRDDASEAETSSLRGRFPWHFGSPTDAQLERFLTKGMVVFDTNGLFDAYRLNPQGRSEFLRTLGLLGDRLWVPHRVADEFGRRRLDVIRECASAVADLTKSLAAHFRKIKAEIEHFGGRRGLKKEDVDELVKLLNENEKQVADRIGEAYRFDLKVADCAAEDPILAEIEVLLDGRVGPPPKDMRQVREDAAYRYERRIPPGYGDTKKPPEEAIGDYVLWVQILQEAARRQVPVLFVTNESKTSEDWVIKPPGARSPLPRPELCAEMWEHAQQPFHLVSVRRFLTLANRYLGADVSDETIAQANEIVETPELALSAVQRILKDMYEAQNYRSGSVVRVTRLGSVSKELFDVVPALEGAGPKIWIVGDAEDERPEPSADEEGDQ
ncbi:PIN-like domain-containing protein [Actinomadura geliboluensis]|uniref:PIN like domain-containing protein n=1 Tax=Actinomadura geliboluensis TaxID=882440 RepID=A0A5S4H615_9ACTN|nr:PIN-like domain-containing protein [Actinomadura geliboluensis]TMR40557.1 hypothetical protein ETD96_10240 [Actinomadura geliboluensis]